MGFLGNASWSIWLIRFPLTRSIPFEQETIGVVSGIGRAESAWALALMTEVGMTRRMRSASIVSVDWVDPQMVSARVIPGRYFELVCCWEISCAISGDLATMVTWL